MSVVHDHTFDEKNNEFQRIALISCLGGGGYLLLKKK